MATRRKPTALHRRVAVLAERNGELQLALESTTALATERGDRIESLLDYFDQRFDEWGKERVSMERTIAVMHKQVRKYEVKLAHLEAE